MTAENLVKLLQMTGAALALGHGYPSVASSYRVASAIILFLRSRPPTCGCFRGILSLR